MRRLPAEENGSAIGELLKMSMLPESDTKIA